ncbi:adenosylcobinamide-phosphate synthase CbiB [Caldimonas tepidiphila]|uniref:adenosylcobinamide-phosphate synthase CbiB n=1 Tax=Caldimonas tepidiphila TaxID=2315841 RepID=UPI000E5A14CE|nr:adenosylcobinamide-phosphate synthase CbiB [Caldimonas tepidiphila]
MPAELALLGAAGAVAVALAVDRALGEPPLRWHPVAWIGRYLGALGPRVRHARPGTAFALGTLAWAAGAALVLAAALALQAALGLVVAWLAPIPLAALVLFALAAGLLLKPLLAWRMLHDEVAAVEDAFAEGLPAARARLSRLVSRDTSALDAHEIREAAIETLAENLNDSVIAPLCWFAAAGLPGAALYRYANTADAMWGYRGDWEWAGKCAARADDVLSWLPARLTALLIGPGAAGWAALRREARGTPSPNGGWPMGAMALRLGVRLGKPGVYALNAAGRAPESDDLRAALTIAEVAVFRGAVCAALLAFALPLLVSALFRLVA